MNAHRFIFDSRNDAADERLEILNDREGVWRCRTIFNCTEALDPTGQFLYSPQPREWSYAKWIRQIAAAVGEPGYD